MQSPNRILVSLPTLPLSKMLQGILVQKLGSMVECKVCEDPFGIYESIHAFRPDTVLVSPNIIGGVDVRNVREDSIGNGVKFVAVCFNAFDEKMSKHYDGNISITDSESVIAETVEKYLSIGTVSGDEEEGEQALTPREKDIVIGVVKGLTNKEIAAELYLSTHTVITHRRNIAKKLQIHSPAGLTIYAIVNKLVELKDVK